MSLSLSVYKEGSPVTVTHDTLDLTNSHQMSAPLGWSPHVTITHDALDLTIQLPTALAPDPSLSAHGHSWPQPPGSDI